MSTLRVNQVVLNDAGNATISIANSWNVSIVSSGQEVGQFRNNGDFVANNRIFYKGGGANEVSLNTAVESAFTKANAALPNGTGTLAGTLTVTGNVVAANITSTGTINATAILVNGVAAVTNGGFSNWQVFTANGTFTIPATITKVKVTVVGGGGGGGYTRESSGGGGGGAAIKIISGLTPGGTVAVTVGNGGAGGTSGSVTGGTGQTSSFGAYCSASGGSGGASNAGSPGTIAGALGGIGSSGDLNIRGGGAGIYFEDSGIGYIGGYGGSSILGGGAPILPHNSGSAGNAGGAYGGGGSGGSSGQNGGAGAAGVVIVEY